MAGMVNHPIKQDVEALKANQRLWRARSIFPCGHSTRIAAGPERYECAVRNVLVIMKI